MNTYKLILWDLDGTLADTSKGVINAVKYAADKMSLPRLSEEIYRKFIGPPNVETYGKYYGLSGSDLERAIQHHRNYAVNQGAAEAELYEGMADLLEHIKSQGVSQGIVTLKLQKSADEVAKNLNITNKIDFVLGSSMNILNKAQLISDCLEKCQFSRQECVLIGDSVYDQMGAGSAGIDFIAVTYGFGFVADGDVHEPYKFIAHSVSELADFLKVK